MEILLTFLFVRVACWACGVCASLSVYHILLPLALLVLVSSRLRPPRACLVCLHQDEGLWDDGSVTLAQLNKAEMNQILSKAQGMSTSQLRSEINKLEGASSRTTSLAASARTQSLVVRGGQITEVSLCSVRGKQNCSSESIRAKGVSPSEERVDSLTVGGRLECNRPVAFQGDSTCLA
jgi:hypothetical protein